MSAGSGYNTLTLDNYIHVRSEMPVASGLGLVLLASLLGLLGICRKGCRL